MRIKTRLFILAVAPLVLLAAIGVMAALTTRGYAQAYTVNRISEGIAEDIFDLDILTYDYLRYHEARAREQWQLKYDSFTWALEEANRAGLDAPELQRIRHNHVEIAKLFARLIAFHQRYGKNVPPPLRDWESRLAAQLLINTQRIFTDAERLADAAHRSTNDQYRRFLAGIIAVLVLIGGITAGVTLRIGRGITGSLGRLQKTVEAIAAGNLDAVLADTGARDEFNELTAAFNTMARKLKGSYVSIENLEAEVARRREVEAALRESEQRLRERSAELETINRDLEAFSYSVSHDLRAPLRAVDGFSRILLEDYEDRLDVEGKRLLHVVRDNTKKMGRMIDDILAFSRAGRLGINRTEIDMEVLARAAFVDLEPMIAGRNVRFEIGKLPCAYGDPAMIRQVLTNLIGNALKFTQSKEDVVIEVGGEPGDGEAVYYVKDNGIGFDMQYAHKLFGVFQRLHSAEKFEGTGIGLAIVHRIVTRHGGRVWAEGKVNEGATFYFTLPRKENADERGEGDRGAAGGGQSHGRGASDTRTQEVQPG